MDAEHSAKPTYYLVMTGFLKEDEEKVLRHPVPTTFLKADKDSREILEVAERDDEQTKFPTKSSAKPTYSQTITDIYFAQIVPETSVEGVSKAAASTDQDQHITEPILSADLKESAPVARLPAQWSTSKSTYSQVMSEAFWEKMHKEPSQQPDVTSDSKTEAEVPKPAQMPTPKPHAERNVKHTYSQLMQSLHEDTSLAGMPETTSSVVGQEEQTIQTDVTVSTRDPVPVVTTAPELAVKSSHTKAIRSSWSQYLEVMVKPHAFTVSTEPLLLTPTSTQPIQTDMDSDTDTDRKAKEIKSGTESAKEDGYQPESAKHTAHSIVTSSTEEPGRNVEQSRSHRKKAATAFKPLTPSHPPAVTNMLPTDDTAQPACLLLTHWEQLTFMHRQTSVTPEHKHTHRPSSVTPEDKHYRHEILHTSVCTECHHSSQPSYVEVMRHAFKPSPKKLQTQQPVCSKLSLLNTLLKTDPLEETKHIVASSKLLETSHVQNLETSMGAGNCPVANQQSYTDVMTRVGLPVSTVQKHVSVEQHVPTTVPIPHPNMHSPKEAEPVVSTPKPPILKSKAAIEASPCPATQPKYLELMTMTCMTCMTHFEEDISVTQQSAAPQIEHVLGTPKMPEVSQILVQGTGGERRHTATQPSYLELMTMICLSLPSTSFQKDLSVNQQPLTVPPTSPQLSVEGSEHVMISSKLSKTSNLQKVESALGTGHCPFIRQSYAIVMTEATTSKKGVSGIQVPKAAPRTAPSTQESCSPVCVLHLLTYTCPLKEAEQMLGTSELPEGSQILEQGTKEENKHTATQPSYIELMTMMCLSLPSTSFQKDISVKQLPASRPLTVPPTSPQLSFYSAITLAPAPKDSSIPELSETNVPFEPAIAIIPGYCSPFQHSYTELMLKVVQHKFTPVTHIPPRTVPSTQLHVSYAQSHILHALTCTCPMEEKLTELGLQLKQRLKQYYLAKVILHRLATQRL
ncbi:PREDICTED: mediator of DNA damage checkpoint protein 1-like isoform X2 [Branchiostoma belcheri]|uniref:Mediator of DNA damage checkpoint protein 1-like isoform X2 n=1 Tax=Branchiostoma belcheri TaxID=7741 RepID=A0A6P4YSW4_BRABE|nr:PREDICTED: mediator of DNA damage checkpoint protein 1-like isoform X2 [Branchiostoma belcheri]